MRPSAPLRVLLSLALGVAIQTTDAQAANCVSKASGEFGAASTWDSCNGNIPGAADDITILAGHAISHAEAATRSASGLTISGSLTIGPLATLRVTLGWVGVLAGGRLELDGGILSFAPPPGGSLALNVLEGGQLDVHGGLIRQGVFSFVDETSTPGVIRLKDDGLDIASPTDLDDPRPGTKLALRVEDGHALGRIFAVVLQSADPATDIFEVDPTSHDAQPVALNALVQTTGVSLRPNDLVVPDTTVRKGHEGIGRWALFHETGNRYLIADTIDGNRGEIRCTGSGIAASYVRDVTTTPTSTTATVRIRFLSDTTFVAGVLLPNYDDYGAGVVGTRFVHPNIEFDLRRSSNYADGTFCEIDLVAEGTSGVADTIRLLVPPRPEDQFEVSGPPGTNDFTLAYGIKPGDAYEIVDPAEIIAEGPYARVLCQDGADCRLERARLQRTGSPTSAGMIAFEINNDDPSPAGEHFHMRRVEIADFEGGNAVLATHTTAGEIQNVEISDCTIHSALSRVPDKGHGIELHVNHEGSIVQRTLFYDTHDDCIFVSGGSGNIVQDIVCMDMDYAANGGDCIDGGANLIYRRNRCFGGVTNGIIIGEGSEAYRNIIIGALQNEPGISRAILATDAAGPARAFGNLLANNGSASNGADLFFNLAIDNERSFERGGEKIVGNFFLNSKSSDTGRDTLTGEALEIVGNLFVEEPPLSSRALLARSLSGPVSIRHNTFALMDGGSKFLDILDFSGIGPTVSAEDNIFYSASAGVVLAYGAWDGDTLRITTDYNLYQTTSPFASTPIPFSPGPNDQAGAPGFLDPNGRDFRLSVGSPAVGSAADDTNRGMGYAGLLCDCLPIPLSELGLDSIAFQRGGRVWNDVDGDGVTDIGNVQIRQKGIRIYLPGLSDPDPVSGFQLRAQTGVDVIEGQVPVEEAGPDVFEVSEETIGAFAALLGQPAEMDLVLSTIEAPVLASVPLPVPFSNDDPHMILDYGCNADTSAEPDGDLDGLVDGCDPNPADVDADDDFLDDGDEDANRNGLRDNGETDPLNPDTDGDGWTDGEEVAAGMNPLDPLDPLNQPGSIPALTPWGIALFLGLLALALRFRGA